MEKKISVIIPAYNEEKTIASVVLAAKNARRVSEIVVVNDGSTDNTSEEARNSGAKIIEIEKRQGKGRAMDVGVKKAENSIICFVDADLNGLTPEMIQKISLPVLDGAYDMYVGIRGRKTYLLNKILRFAPLLAGERAVTREVWEKIPDKFKKNFQIEIAMNYFAKQNGKKMGFEIIPGLSQTIKEKKYGFWIGFGKRIAMSWDIFRVSFDLYVAHSLKKFFSKKNS